MSCEINLMEKNSSTPATSKKCCRFLGYHYSMCGISKIAQIILIMIFKMPYVNNVAIKSGEF